MRSGDIEVLCEAAYAASKNCRRQLELLLTLSPKRGYPLIKSIPSLFALFVNVSYTDDNLLLLLIIFIVFQKIELKLILFVFYEILRLPSLTIIFGLLL